MTLRIYADFNSGGSGVDDPCWCLRYGEERRPLDDVAKELGLKPGMLVTLFYEDSSEEFEVSGSLTLRNSPPNQWVAVPDWSTLRRIRG